MRAIDGHLNHPKNRLMMWIIELVQLLILAIDRKCILREVVGADAEEIDELCQLLTDHHCCRRLDHDALLRNRIRDLLPLEFCRHLCDDLTDPKHLIYGDDHRIHDGEVSVLRRTKQCAELCLKHIRLFQTDTDRAIPHRRVIFLSESEVIDVLIRTDVERSDDHLLSAHRL